MGGEFRTTRVFEDMSIRTKITLGFATILFILLATSAVAIWTNVVADDEVRNYSDKVAVLTAADELDRDVLELRRNAREYAITSRADDAVRAKEIIATLRPRITKLADDLENPSRLQRVQQLSRRFERYAKNFDRIHQHGEEVKRLVEQVMDQSADQFDRDVQAVRGAAAKAGNGAVVDLADTALDHGGLARLYANQLLGRRDVAFAKRARGELDAVIATLDSLERAVRDDALQGAVEDIRTLVGRYHDAVDRIAEVMTANLELTDDVNFNLAEAIGDDVAYIRDTAIAEARISYSRAQDLMDWTTRLVIVLAVLGMGLGVVLVVVIGNAIARPVVAMTGALGELAAGRLDVAVPGLGRRDEIGEMAKAARTFQEAAVKLDSQSWVNSNIAALATAVQATETPRDFVRAALSALMPPLGGGAGVIYLWEEEGETLELAGSWGFRTRRHLSTSFRLGEGIVGQCAAERAAIILTEVPDDYLRIVSGTGEAAPRTIMAVPLVARDRLLGVAEIASFVPFSGDRQALMDEAAPVIALNLEVQDRNHRTRVLLERTQRQAEELRASEEELKAQSEQIQCANEDLRIKTQSLEDQAEELRASEEELKVQREELQATNEELSEKTNALELQAMRLEDARRQADDRALERDSASRYKSEFLANMSHELRTPLNSLLILARSLSENEDGNMTEDQVDSARIISESGTHLLRLINDILDISKVEAGKMVANVAAIQLSDYAQSINRRFGRLAEAKNLELITTIGDGAPATISSDAGKLDQIVNNLVGNALKFTEAGRIAVTFRAHGNGGLAIDVADSGIGVPADKLEGIFAAFEQVDGSTSRSFGGTGLGLTISRKLARFLGGEVTVASELGRGSTFSLTLPAVFVPPSPQCAPAPVSVPGIVPPPPRGGADSVASPTCAPAVPDDDDREAIAPGDETILVIEDDPAFARIVRDSARRRGFKSLMALDGRTGVELARRHRPTGIVLDVGLPGMDGWTVMESLKRHAETRHIPVHFMSADDADRRGLEMGAVGFFTKPVTREQINQAFDRIGHFSGSGIRRLLLVEDDDATRKAVDTLLAGDKSGESMEIVEATTGAAAIALLRDGGPFDCMILDLGLPDMDGRTLLGSCVGQGLTMPPVVVYSARDLSEAETMGLREYTDSVVIKGARSPDRLLDEVTLFLHSVQAGRNAGGLAARRAADPVDERARGTDGPLVLVVDDDMRNTFALSKVLRRKGFRVLMAQDGRTALDQLKENPSVDVVLMDIMMPGMDGYEATSEIRKIARFRTLPIITLTAKAMMGDREKCLEAGADDYVSKPVDIDILLESIRRLVKTG